MQVNTNVELDLIQFLKTLIEGIESDYEFSYPMNRFDENRAHTSLQSIKGRVRSLKALVNAVKVEEKSKNEN